MINYIYLDCNKFNKRQLFDFIKINNVQPIRITKDDYDYKILVNKVSKSNKDKLKTIYIFGCMKLKYA